MKKIINKYYSILILTVLFSISFPMVVYANSSWQWISKTRPYDVLPYVIIVTLLIESLGLYLLINIRPFSRIFFIVLAGNLLSFLLPYLLNIFDPIFPLERILETTPFYAVGALYLISTIIAEVPLCYWYLSKITEEKKRLLYTLIILNTITTIITACVERYFCRGGYTH